MQNFVKITLVLTEISTEMTEILIGIVNYDIQYISKTFLSSNELMNLKAVSVVLESAVGKSILNWSPTSQSCLSNISSTISVTNIDVAEHFY